MKRMQSVLLFTFGLLIGGWIVFLVMDVPTASADYGNPWGHRAGGRFDYYCYDDAMEILTDTETGQEYLVWYWRDDVEIQPLWTTVEVPE